MTHLCTCGHLPLEHLDEKWRCNGTSYDDHYDSIWSCVCPMYTKDSDD